MPQRSSSCKMCLGPLPLHLQLLVASKDQELIMCKRLTGREAQTRQASGKRFQRNPQFHACSRSADTKVNAMPKGDMAIGSAMDIKDMRIGKLPLVPISSSDESK